MKLVKDVKLECEVAQRMWDTAHAQLKYEDEAYYQGVMVALEWVLEKYEDPFIPMYGGPLEHEYC
jgi:hypothetical protein